MKKLITSSWLLRLEHGLIAVSIVAVIATMFRKFGVDGAAMPVMLALGGFVLGYRVRFTKWEREMDEALARARALTEEEEDE